MTKKIELKDRVIFVSNCEICPCANWEWVICSAMTTNVMDDEKYPLDSKHIPKFCPLEDC